MESFIGGSVGRYKLNSDATVLGGGKIGYGAMVRDHVGDVVLATCGQVDAGSDPIVAEGLALRSALCITIEAGFCNLIIETDCSKVFML